jgi:hypothetical protein
METIRSTETSVLTTTTWHQIPEDDFLHRYRRENLKSYIRFHSCSVKFIQRYESINWPSAYPRFKAVLACGPQKSHCSATAVVSSPSPKLAAVKDGDCYQQMACHSFCLCHAVLIVTDWAVSRKRIQAAIEKMVFSPCRIVLHCTCCYAAPR